MRNVLETAGNTIAASTPLVLYEAVSSGRARRGDEICCSATAPASRWPASSSCTECDVCAYSRVRKFNTVSLKMRPAAPRTPSLPLPPHAPTASVSGHVPAPCTRARSSRRRHPEGRPAARGAPPSSARGCRPRGRGGSRRAPRSAPTSACSGAASPPPTSSRASRRSTRAGGTARATRRAQSERAPERRKERRVRMGVGRQAAVGPGVAWRRARGRRAGCAAVARRRWRETRSPHLPRELRTHAARQPSASPASAGACGEFGDARRVRRPAAASTEPAAARLAGRARPSPGAARAWRRGAAARCTPRPSRAPGASASPGG